MIVYKILYGLFNNDYFRLFFIMFNKLKRRNQIIARANPRLLPGEAPAAAGDEGTPSVLHLIK